MTRLSVSAELSTSTLGYAPRSKSTFAISKWPWVAAEYNAWLNSVPQHVKEMLFVVKRFYVPSWGGDWRHRFLDRRPD